MSENGAGLTNYEVAISAYKRKTKIVRYSIVFFTLLAVFSLFIWPESSLPNLIAIGVAALVVLYVIWRRRVWKSLEGEHGLTNG